MYGMQGSADEVGLLKFWSATLDHMLSGVSINEMTSPHRMKCQTVVGVT